MGFVMIAFQSEHETQNPQKNAEGLDPISPNLPLLSASTPLAAPWIAGRFKAERRQRREASSRTSRCHIAW